MYPTRNPEVAGKSAEMFDRSIEKAAFRLELGDDESIQWHLKQNDGDIIYDKEPYVSFWKKLGVWFIGLLPVGFLL
jgi:hypothetical protein